MDFSKLVATFAAVKEPIKIRNANDALLAADGSSYDSGVGKIHRVAHPEPGVKQKRN